MKTGRFVFASFSLVGALLTAIWFEFGVLGQLGASWWPASMNAPAAAAAASVVATGSISTAPTGAFSTPPPWASSLANQEVYGVRAVRNVVALTFDDGPSVNTQEIVDDLWRSGDRATFFFVGSRITTAAAQYAVAHGEELGNHTWNHLNMHKLKSEEASAEIGLTSARIAEITGAPPTWFRSPFSRLYQEEVDQIANHGLLYGQWTVGSRDWQHGITESQVLHAVEEGLRPGAVIVMHDNGTCSTPRMLPDVLALIRRRGYEVVTLSELAQQGEPLTRSFQLGDNPSLP